MSKVVELNPEHNPDNLMEEAKGQYHSAVILGFDSEGGIRIMSANMPVTDLIYLLEKTKLVVLE